LIQHGRDNRLVLISAASAVAEPELTGMFWTTMATILNDDGSLKTAAEIKELLSLPQMPASAVVGGIIASGTAIVMGATPENAVGTGFREASRSGAGISAPIDSIVMSLR